MRIDEVSDTQVDSGKLMALAQFLSGRSQDQDAKKQISQQAFVDLARNLGVMITPDSLVEIVAKPPLSNILEPIEPNSGVVRFKGNLDKSTQMSVNQAEKIVDKNAKAAMRRMGS